MTSKENKQWGFIFEQLGQANLRKMLFKMAVNKDENGRVVVEFRGDQALDVTEHVEEMESNIDE